ncbi:phosphotransferase [Actinoplanes sp. TFC3]|uniref:phosphotransferase n=1 Tax=Actinoplanes sp. TFC3 TaxID=1710355 RepID=UPI0009EAAAAF|nr:phosphotransferase [Actinoplanes sp. TFC3]
MEEGLNSSVAALLCTPTGRYFVKALPSDHRWVWTQAREAEIADFVKPVAPALHKRVVHFGWDVLVFEALEGHQADYAPGSDDLHHAADLLTRIGELSCPNLALRQAEQRLQAYTDASELQYFAGGALLHTDLNNANVIVGGRQTRIVDWGWATRGAPWLDAGYWVIWLIAAGHNPRAAEQWAEQVPAWRTAPPQGVAAFAAANARMWSEAGGGNPDPWIRRLVDASAMWNQHRLTGRPAHG